MENMVMEKVQIIRVGVMNKLLKSINNLMILIKFRYKRLMFRPILMLNFHQISEDFNPEIDTRSIWTSINDFDSTIQFLKKLNYYFITLDEAIKILENNLPRKKHYAVITFDDGYASILNVLPYLTNNSIPATFFINTAYLDDKQKNWVDILNYIHNIDGENIVDDEFKIAAEKLNSTQDSAEFMYYKEIVEDLAATTINWTKRYLTTEALYKITNPIFTVGLHGHEHYKYDIMSESLCRSNLEKNISILKTHPNYVPIFAFPFGRWRSENLSLIKSYNLKAIFCSNRLNYAAGVGYNRISVSNENVNWSFLAEKSKESTILNKMYRRMKTYVKP